MIVRAMVFPENGMNVVGRSDVAMARHRPRVSNALSRLVEIMRRNEDLLRRVEILRKRLARAQGYAADPFSDPALAAGMLEHTRSAYAAVLNELRVNRVEALAILRVCGHAEAPCPTSKCN